MILALFFTLLSSLGGHAHGPTSKPIIQSLVPKAKLNSELSKKYDVRDYPKRKIRAHYPNPKQVQQLVEVSKLSHETRQWDAMDHKIFHYYLKSKSMAEVKKKYPYLPGHKLKVAMEFIKDSNS
jgi:hypothetical protein